MSDQLGGCSFFRSEVTMRRFRTVFAALMLVATGAVLSAQLPGPPVGAPQSNQNFSRGYNFQYNFTPSTTTGTGFTVNPTLNLTTATGQNDDLMNVTGTIVLPNSSSSVTQAAGLHVGTLVVTLNSGTATTAANLVVDAAPATGTTKLSALFKGDVQMQQTGGVGVSLVGGTSCGASLAAGGACPNTAGGGTFHVVTGTFLLSGSTSTVTGISPAFTSSTSWNCVANDITTRANPVQSIPASGTSTVITNTTGATDLISMICAGI